MSLARLEQAARNPGSAPGRRVNLPYGHHAEVQLRIQDDRLTFGRIAEEWSRELTDAKVPGLRTRDQIFHKMLKALWHGDFETDEGESCLSIVRPPRGGAKRGDGRFVNAKHQLAIGRYEPINRRWLLAAMPPIAGLSLPHKSRLWPSGEIEDGVFWADLKNEIPWDMLITLRPDEYDDLFRRSYLEELSILKDRFGEWCLSQGNRRPVFWFEKDAAPNEEAQKKGGSRPTYNKGLQSFINQRSTEFAKTDKPFTLSTLKDWLLENARADETYESGIADCDDLEFVEHTLFWEDRRGNPHSRRARSLEPYIQRAKQR